MKKKHVVDYFSSAFNFHMKYKPMHRRRYQGKLVPAEEKFPSEDEKFLLDHQESHHNVLHLHSKFFCKDGNAQFTALSDQV